MFLDVIFMQLKTNSDRTMNKILIINIIVAVFSQTNAFSQVGGLSNSKVVLPATATVAAGDFEFEPSFDVFWYNQEWNLDGKTIDNSDIIRFSSISYRFTSGFKHNIEVGLAVPENVSSLNFGLKWLFWKNNGKSFALQSGVNFATHDGIIGNTQESMTEKFLTEESKRVLVNGLIFTYEPNEKLSIDTDATFSLYSSEIDLQTVNYSGTLDIGAGYFLTNRFQTILELNSAWISFENSIFNSSKTNGTLGIKYTPNDGTAIIFGLKQDLFGSNNPKGLSFVGAFTFLMG